MGNIDVITRITLGVDSRSTRLDAHLTLGHNDMVPSEQSKKHEYQPLFYKYKA